MVPKRVEEKLGSLPFLSSLASAPRAYYKAFVLSAPARLLPSLCRSFRTKKKPFQMSDRFEAFFLQAIFHPKERRLGEGSRGCYE